MVVPLPIAATSRGAPGAVTLFAGPAAWFVELTVGYALATQPCFPAELRLTVPSSQLAWTQPALMGLAAACTAVALWAFLISFGVLRRYAREHTALATDGSRSKFAALWGAAFGGGFLVATLLTGVGLVLLPRCGG